MKWVEKTWGVAKYTEISMYTEFEQTHVPYCYTKSSNKGQEAIRKLIE